MVEWFEVLKVSHEYITEEVIKLAWQSIGGDDERLEINSKNLRSR